MQIYVLNFSLIGLYYLMYQFLVLKRYKETQVKTFFIWLMTLQLFCILALRSATIGYDLGGYLTFFQDICSNPEYTLMTHRFEIGYKVLNYLISLISSDERVFICIIAAGTIAPIGIFISKYSSSPFLSFAVYIALNYYAFTFSGLRQALAYGIVLLSYEYIKGQKLLRFIVVILFASMFHSSALVFLPAYFVYRIKLNIKSITAFIVLDMIVFIFRKAIFNYIITNVYESYYILESKAYIWMLFCLLIVIAGMFVYKKVKTTSPDYAGLYPLLITGVSLMLFASVGNNVIRIAGYYYLFVIIFIPEVLSVIKSSRMKLTLNYFVILLLCCVTLWFLNSGAYGIVPYQFFWQVK